MIDKIKDLKRMRNEEGFSLIELVVAVGILAILSVVGVVAYSKITENTRKAAVEAAAAEVYTGAVAYDANGQDYEQAAVEWMNSAANDSITVEATKPNGKDICVEATVGEPHNITAYKGAGCASEGVEDPDNGVENDSSATAAECFGFAAGVITDYKEELEECGSDVVIPETINGETVVGIGDYAFRGRGNQLTSVVIPDSVITIGRWSFADNQLTSVVIPSSVKTIGDQAFEKNQLNSVEFNEGLETIGDQAFYANQLTGSIEFPSSLKSIGYYTFRNNNLTSVSIPKSLSSGGLISFDLGVRITRY